MFLQDIIDICFKSDFHVCGNFSCDLLSFGMKIPSCNSLEQGIPNSSPLLEIDTDPYHLTLLGHGFYHLILTYEGVMSIGFGM